MQSKLNMQALLTLWGQAAESGMWTEGRFVRSFEDKVSDLYQQRAVAFNSAGTALYSVIRVMGLTRVIAPTNTFWATVGMAQEAGCQVTLADCGPDLSLSLEAVKAAYDGTQQAVILTHVGGGIAQDYAAIAQWCDEYGLHLIEDAAHAFGLTDPLAPGSLGVAAVFSFYPTKAVPVGEGGMVICRDPEMATALSVFRNYGKYKEGGVIKYQGTGFNFRMDEWTAAVGCYQLDRLPELLTLRAQDAEVLTQIVKPLVSWQATNWYKFIAPSSFPAKKQVGKVYARTDQCHHILGLSGFPVAEAMSDAHICLPIGEGMYADMSTDQVESYLRGIE